MKRIYIVSGNGFARECANLLKLCVGYGEDFTFGGFIGHNGYGALVDNLSYKKSYVCDLSELELAQDIRFVIGCGDPALRSIVYEDIVARGGKLVNLIGPHCVLPDTFELGEGNIFFAPFYGSVDTKIGNGNVFNSDILLGHDVEIGDCNFFGPRSCCLGSVRVGNLNSFGAASVLLPKVQIGDGNIISPMSCVYKGCRNGRKLHGNPALFV